MLLGVLKPVWSTDSNASGVGKHTNQESIPWVARVVSMGAAVRLEVVPDFRGVDLSALPFEDDDERRMDMWR